MADVVERDEEQQEEEQQPPDWLPDGWIMEVRKGNNGSIYRYYTSPVSGYTFSTKVEVLHYLLAEVDESAFEAQACSEDRTLQLTESTEDSYKWLPVGWIIEIRAGGRKLEKMYKCYVDPHTGLRFFSKEDVFCYVKEGKLCNPYLNGECDTSSEDNILAQLEFYPDGLPDGWVKETTFRKCKDGIRKDPYYTDPATHYVFRTLKDVVRYLETGEISKHAYIPRRSVVDLYAFEKSADLPPGLSKRLKMPGNVKRPPFEDCKPKSKKELVIKKEELSIDQTSTRSEDGGASTCSAPKSRLKEKKPYKRKASKLTTLKATKKAKKTSKTSNKEKERPLAILKPTNMNMSEHAKSSHHEAAERHIVVKQEVESESEEVLECLLVPKKKKLEAATKAKETPIPIKKAKDKTLVIMKPTDMNMSEHAESLDSESEMGNHDIVKQEVESESEEAGGNLSAPREKKLDSVTEPNLHQQEKGNSTQDGVLLLESMACSSAEEKLQEPETEELWFTGEKQLPSGTGLKKTCHTSRSKEKNSVPRRASNRLAGFEALPGDESVLGWRFRSGMSSKRKCNQK